MVRVTQHPGPAYLSTHTRIRSYYYHTLDPREYTMTAFRTYLSHLTDVDRSAAEQTRDKLLDELTVPSAWSVSDTTVELSQDDTNDWLLVTFQNETHPDRIASVYLLEGSHSLHVYHDSDAGDEWVEPTRDPGEITSILRTRA